MFGPLACPVLQLFAKDFILNDRGAVPRGPKLLTEPFRGTFEENQLPGQDRLHTDVAAEWFVTARTAILHTAAGLPLLFVFQLAY